jgi:ribose 5-phosphate isomerase B
MNDKLRIIGIASDHAGFELKQTIKKYLDEKDYQVVDFGTNSLESMDYPDVIHPLCKSIENKKIDIGIIMCGSGNGVNITANKYPYIRSALCWLPEISALSKQHNNANIIALPARFLSNELAINIVDSYLSSDFEGGRHQRRVEKITDM